MMPASAIKKTIDFNARFRSLLEVLKLIAVSQYHTLEKKLATFEELTQIINEFFDAIDVRDLDHPFLKPGNRPMGVVAITSDAGLLGGLNMQVMSRALDLAKNQNGKLIIVGEKGQGYAQDAGMSFAYFPGVVDSERYAQAFELRDYLTQKVMAGELGPVTVVYPRPLSIVMIRVEMETLLPLSMPEKPAGSAASLQSKAVIVESRPEDVIEYLLYVLMGERLYEIFGLSRLAEQAARFTHLEESCSKIQDMNKKLLLQYFKRRHEVIDQNMREIFCAAKTMHVEL
jgi:ATP synthase F1 gamma subunit